jgi:hypothetical protein
VRLLAVAASAPHLCQRLLLLLRLTARRRNSAARRPADP